MLSAIAILERELGSIEYARHLLKDRIDAPDRGELRALSLRRQRTLRLLDELYAQRAQRQPDAGRAVRARPARRR